MIQAGISWSPISRLYRQGGSDVINFFLIALDSGNFRKVLEDVIPCESLVSAVLLETYHPILNDEEQ